MHLFTVGLGNYPTVGTAALIVLPLVTQYIPCVLMTVNNAADNMVMRKEGKKNFEGLLVEADIQLNDCN